MLPKRIAAALASTALAGSVLSGCGSSSDLSSLSTTQLLHKAATAVKQAPSVAVTGDAGGGSASIDMTYVGNSSQGTARLGGGAQLQMESVKGTLWIHPNAAFWHKQVGSNAAAINKLIKGRWIKVQNNDPSFQLAREYSSRSFVSSCLLFSECGPDKSAPPSNTDLSKGASATIDGRKAIALVGPAGKLYLDAQNAQPLRIIGTGSNGKGQASFSYEQATPPVPPSKNNQIDLAHVLPSSK